jgi:hypothetical protein
MTVSTPGFLILALFAMKAVAAGPAARVEQAEQAEQAAHGAHGAGVDQRGDQAMGFSHGKTAHHFVLTKTGGEILASAADPKDAKSPKAIASHFRHIASAFKRGDFEMPMFIHDRAPPGVPAMKRLASEIDYRVEETPTGGRVVITTQNPVALKAIHEFLRFQIEDHRTGDDTDVRP